MKFLRVVLAIIAIVIMAPSSYSLRLHMKVNKIQTSSFSSSSSILRNIAVSTLLSFSFLNPPIAQANVLEGATKAMMEKSERRFTDDRSFDALPLATKRRKALALCKSNEARENARYSSASVCTNDVLNDNYKIAAGVTLQPEPEELPSSLPERSSSSSTSPSSSKALSSFEQKMSAMSTPSAPPSKKLVIVNDLSDLNPAQKKR